MIGKTVEIIFWYFSKNNHHTQTKIIATGEIMDYSDGKMSYLIRLSDETYEKIKNDWHTQKNNNDKIPKRCTYRYWDGILDIVEKDILP